MADVKEPRVSSSLEDNTNDESTLVRKFKSTERCELSNQTTYLMQERLGYKQVRSNSAFQRGLQRTPF